METADKKVLSGKDENLLEIYTKSFSETFMGELKKAREKIRARDSRPVTLPTIEPIDIKETNWRWDTANRKRLWKIDNNIDREGILGSRDILKALKRYLTDEKRNRKDIANTLSLKDGRIVTTLHYQTIFLQR